MVVLSHVQLFALLWTVICQVPLSTGFSSQEYWSGLAFPTPGDLPDPGIESTSLSSPALAGRFFATEPRGKLQNTNGTKGALEGHIQLITKIMSNASTYEAIMINSILVAITIISVCALVRTILVVNDRLPTDSLRKN